MTEKLYIKNAYLKEVEANVLLNRKFGNEFHIILDKTIFYPDGAGGQRGDKGSINGIEIVKSFERDGKIVHITKEKVSGSTGTVKIDWDNRFHIMQQHTGQHLVSSCFYRLFGIPTLSFHASSDHLNIDLDTDSLSYEDISKVEELANTIIQYNFPVKTYFPSDEEKDVIDFRRTPKVEENLRVVEIDSIDYSACGGTHVNYTGELGLIKITEAFKQNKKIRIKVLVGNESLLDYSNKDRIFQNLSEKLSANEENIIEKFDNYKNSFQELHDSYSSLKNEFFLLQKEVSKENSVLLNGYNLLIEEFNRISFSNANEYAKLFEEEDLVLVLYNKKNEMVQFIIKRCGNVNINMELLMNRLRNAYNLKGGGNKNVIQGIIFISNEDNIENVFKEELNKLEN